MAQSFACITDPTAEPYAKQQPAGDAFRRRDQPAASRAAPINRRRTAPSGSRP
jgi:hypothetical protein